MDKVDFASSAFNEFAAELLELPWGSLSKGELEFRVFQLLADTGKLELSRSDVELAQNLATTLAKVRALRYKSQQRKFRTKNVWNWDDLLSVEHVTLYSVADKGAAMVLYAKDPFLKEVLSEKLREEPIPVLVRSSLTAGHLKVDGVAFWMKVLEDGTLSDVEYSKIQAKLKSTFPKQDSKLSQVFEGANRGAGAANVASFALDFFNKIAGAN